MEMKWCLTTKGTNDVFGEHVPIGYLEYETNYWFDEFDDLLNFISIHQSSVCEHHEYNIVMV